MGEHVEEEYTTFTRERKVKLYVYLDDDHMIFVKMPGAIGRFETKDEFRQFLKMLMRFDERL